MKKILEYNSYEIILLLKNQILKIFPYVKIVTNKIYASTLINKSGNPIVRIDSKNSIKALLLEVNENSIIIKSIVNKTSDRRLIEELIKIFETLPNDFKIIIEQDVSGGFWERIIQKYPKLNWVKL